MIRQNVLLLAENIHSDCIAAKGLDHGFGLAPIFIEKKAQHTKQQQQDSRTFL
jgi:hypothetical protein